MKGVFSMTTTFEKGCIFTASEKGLAGSTCSAMVKRGVLKVVGTARGEVVKTLDNGHDIIRTAKIYKAI